MTALLQVEGLRVEAGPVPLLHGLDFSVAPGEFVAVVGESGSGKTMAARALMRLLPPGVRQVAGRVALDGLDLGPIPLAKFRRLRGPGLGMVFQEPMTSLNPSLTVGTQMAEGLRLHRGLGKREAAERCAAILDRVGIPNPERCLAAHPHEFSGGMRQRIAVASAMLLRPRVLVADEPTTALDTLVQREVLDLMTALARDAGSAVLLITHNLGLVGRYCSRALVLQGGRLVEEGAVDDILRRPQDPYTKRLVAALPRRGSVSPPRHGAPLLQVRGLAVTHRRPAALFRRAELTRAVDGVDLDVHEGEVVALVGGSGCGKTTLGRAVLQLLPYEGTVRFGGQPVDARSLRAFRLDAQLVFQDPYSSLDPRMRVAAIVAEPLRHVAGMSGAERARRVADVLQSVGLDRLSGRFPHELSGGQRQRVAIARAVVRRPRFVVADEPVSALDMTVQAQVLDLFQRLQREHGFACLFISHDLGAVSRIADRVVVMQAGRVVEDGARDQVLDAPRHAYTRALLEASPARPA